MTQEDVFKKVVSHCRRYGFVFSNSDTYDGLATVYDYGQNGVELKNDIKQCQQQSMVLLHSNIAGIGASIFMRPTVWKTDGHVDTFNDPLIDSRNSKKRYRADNFIEDQVGKYGEKIEKKVAKAAKKFGEPFDEAKFREANPRVLENQKGRDDPHARYTKVMQGPDLEALKQIILDEGIVDPISGTTNWTNVRQFNLIFSTEMGASASAANKICLRLETVQSIFVNFLNVQETGRMKLPFGTCQIGKAFRNEIVARQFVFRMREFEQVGVQFLCQLGTGMKWFEYWKKHRLVWHEGLGMDDESYRLHDHERLVHHANVATGIGFHMPSSFKEVEGTHSRTSFDLSQHEKYSDRQVKYFGPERNENYTPYVVKTSIGVNRMFLSVMCHSYIEEALKNDSSRVVLKLPEPLTSVKCAVLPLVSKDDLPEKAQEIVNSLRFHFNTHMKTKDSIGKCYRRQDAIGAPFCVIVDGDTLTDSTVTLCYRDSMKQERIPVEELRGIIEDRVSITALLKKIDIDQLKEGQQSRFFRS